MRFLFCPKCGHSMDDWKEEAVVRRRCPACGYIQYRNPTVGVAVILLEKGKILLARRLGSYEGQWCIPCGHVEWDEDIREAARREFLEETGITVQVGELFDAHSNFHNANQHTVGLWFLGKRLSGRPTPGSDASELQFFPLDAIPENMAFPTDWKVLEKLRAIKGKPGK